MEAGGCGDSEGQSRTSGGCTSDPEARALFHCAACSQIGAGLAAVATAVSLLAGAQPAMSVSSEQLLFLEVGMQRMAVR